MCAGRMGRLRNRLVTGMPWDGKFDQPIDHTNGGPPVAALMVTGI